jgi:anti-sigma factor RsiW
MTDPVDPITEADLQAYVDDELSPERRIAVEAHLCRHPAQATQVMADLRTRDELRLALASLPRMRRVATTDAARRVEHGLSRDRFLRGMRKVAAVLLLIGLGWFAHSQSGPLGVGEVVASVMPPAYVTDAVRAHRTTLLRAGMRSQPEAPDYDPAEIRAATAIVIPNLPEDWVVADVQIFPSSFGPSVEMAIRTPDFGTVSLYAVRPGAFDVVPATLVPQAELTAAYWQMGEVAYTLIAVGNSDQLDKAATRLAGSLH